MKIKVIALATFVSAVFAGSTMAYDGTITFTGKVVAQTCTVNTSDKDLAVTFEPPRESWRLNFLRKR